MNQTQKNSIIVLAGIIIVLAVGLIIRQFSERSSPAPRSQGNSTGNVQSMADNTGVENKAVGKADGKQEITAGKSAEEDSITEQKEKDPDYSPVDISNIVNIKDKIAKILERFDGCSGYQHDNELVKQIAGLGKDAIPFLVDFYEQIKSNPELYSDSFFRKSAIEDALDELLTEDNKDIILKYYAEEGMFRDKIKSYRFPESENIVMNRISEALKTHPVTTSISEDEIDAALIMNQNRAVPLLIDYLKNGVGNEVAHAAQRLALIPGLDIVEPLRQAAKNTSSQERKGLISPMLDRGMAEGLDVALQLLSTKPVGPWPKHTDPEICEMLTKYTGVLGNPEDITLWLEKNKDKLVWNPSARKFELSNR